MVRVAARQCFSPRKRASRTHLTGEWVGPKTVLDAEVGRKFLCLFRGVVFGSFPLNSENVIHSSSFFVLLLLWFFDI
jgi:hypothetical protein